VRTESSGTTFAFTNHLSAISKGWRDGPGVGTTIQWPATHIGARGNEGVAAHVARIPGAIGYSEYGIAERAKLAMAQLENKEGTFVMPTADSGHATLLSAELPANLRAFFPDPDGKQSYPIVTYTWLLLYKQYADAQKAKAIKDFVKWGLTQGQRCNEPLGYVRVPPAVEAKALAAMQRIGN
jgi:phosphate transport system substrate-binding protein